MESTTLWWQICPFLFIRVSFCFPHAKAAVMGWGWMLIMHCMCREIVGRRLKYRIRDLGLRVNCVSELARLVRLGRSW
jgi:hypothetical protein